MKNILQLQHGMPFPIWPDAAPGSAHLANEEVILERSTDPENPDRAATRITIPTLTPWQPAHPNGVAIIIAPGGAYERVVLDKEGEEICQWLASIGITGFVLKYRLPNEGHDNGYLVPMQDMQRAMRVVRANADAWGLDARRIGAMGFSAGGHVAGTAMTCWDYPAYPSMDEIDAISARPDFSILGYPVCGIWDALRSLPVDERAKLVTQFETDKHVRADMPPAFLFHADDDPAVPSEQSVRIYSAMKEANIEAELHIFQHGGHGFGIRRAQGPAAQWPQLCHQWLENLDLIK